MLETWRSNGEACNLCGSRAQWRVTEMRGERTGSVSFLCESCYRGQSRHFSHERAAKDFQYPLT